MFRIANQLTKVTKTCVSGFHTGSASQAISRFNLPAMSPTMTEGTIHQWKKQEGDSFIVGDVLLELETDKAQIDVEAAEDGVLAKILLQNGSKAPVNTLIALLAEEGDDISNVQVPEDAGASAAADTPTEEKKEEQPQQQRQANASPVKPISHHDIDTSKLKKPLSPAVLSLVLKHGIKDVNSIKASGYGGRILKGDVLAHIGLIKPKPAPHPTLSIAPPRDQIVFAKTNKKETKAPAPPAPTFISKEIVIDELLSLRQVLNEQNGTRVSVNDFIAKAAERALQDVVVPVTTKQEQRKTIVYGSASVKDFSAKYTGGSFKVFNLAEPNYDFITDSYQASKPYLMTVGGAVAAVERKKVSADCEMMSLIDYLAGSAKKEQEESRAIRLNTKQDKIDRKDRHRHVEVKLDGFVPGKILADPKANAFLGRVEYYIRNPNEIVV